MMRADEKMRGLKPRIFESEESARLPFVQKYRQGDEAGIIGIVALHAANQQIESGLGPGLRRRVHAGEAGVHFQKTLDIVHGNHGHVLRDALAQLPQGGQQLQSGKIVEGEDGVNVRMVFI